MLVDIYNVPGIILCIIWESPWTETCSYDIGLQTGRLNLFLLSLEP